MQSGYKLNIGIQAVFNATGIETLQSIILANILADYGAYEEYPATKVILKDILSNGYGIKVYDTFKSNTQSTKSLIDNIRITFQKQSNYKEDYVKYVFDSICYGLGIISTIEEPSSNSLDPYAKESDDILDNLPEMLLSLKKDYDDALKTLLVKPKDLIWDAPAYYTSAASNQLYLILGKIEVVSNQLGTNDFDVYKKKKEQILRQNKDHKIQAVTECLNYKNEEYQKLLSKALIKPSSSFIGKSGYYSDKLQSDINKAESEIVSLYNEAELPYDNWCENHKKSLLAPYQVSTSAQIRQVALKIVLPTVIICSGGYFGGTYYTSMAEITDFDNGITYASQLILEQKYGEAITEYMKVGEKYNALFRTSSYKSDAIDKADECFNLMKIETDSKLRSKKFAEALSTLNAIPNNYLSINQDNKSWIDKTKIEIVNLANQEVDGFAEKISQNNGKLSEEDKKYLKELLSISPDNYWLKLIWNREK